MHYGFAKVLSGENLITNQSTVGRKLLCRMASEPPMGPTLLTVPEGPSVGGTYKWHLEVTGKRPHLPFLKMVYNLSLYIIQTRQYGQPRRCFEGLMTTLYQWNKHIAQDWTGKHTREILSCLEDCSSQPFPEFLKKAIFQFLFPPCGHGYYGLCAKNLRGRVNTYFRLNVYYTRRGYSKGVQSSTVTYTIVSINGRMLTH